MLEPFLLGSDSLALLNIRTLGSEQVEVLWLFSSRNGFSFLMLIYLLLLLSSSGKGFVRQVAFQVFPCRHSDF